MLWFLTITIWVILSRSRWWFHRILEQAAFTACSIKNCILKSCTKALTIFQEVVKQKTKNEFFRSTKRFLFLPFSASENIILYCINLNLRNVGNTYIYVTPKQLPLTWNQLIRRKSTEKKKKQKKKKQTQKAEWDKNGKSGIHEIIDSVCLQGHFPHIQSCQWVELS